MAPSSAGRASRPRSSRRSCDTSTTPDTSDGSPGRRLGDPRRVGAGWSRSAPRSLILVRSRNARAPPDTERSLWLVDALRIILEVLLVITSIFLILSILMHKGKGGGLSDMFGGGISSSRSEEHTSELQSRGHLVCRLLLEKKKNTEQR